MDSMSYRNNRPAAQRQADSAPSVSQPVAATTPSLEARSPRSHKLRKSPKKRLMGIALVVAAVLIVAVAAWVLIGRTGAAAAIDSGKYQAVFFTNGQVYFGKLSQLNGEYMSLKNVYYLQSKSTSTDDKTSPQSASKQNASDVELIKLGNEIHGPEDQMVIAKDQILFFENLKPQGTVSKTITSFQQKN